MVFPQSYKEEVICSSCGLETIGRCVSIQARRPGRTISTDPNDETGMEVVAKLPVIRDRDSLFQTPVSLCVVPDIVLADSNHTPRVALQVRDLAGLLPSTRTPRAVCVSAAAWWALACRSSVEPVHCCDDPALRQRSSC